MRRFFWPLVVTAVLMTFLLVAVFPTRTYLHQRAQLAATEERLTVLAEQNAALEERRAQLQTDAEIERLAREQYNLVKPGEEAYAILPPAVEEPPTVKASAEEPPDDDRSLWERVVEFVLP